MSYTDYLNWAEEYKQQEIILDRKLDERKRKNKKLTFDQIVCLEQGTRELYAMKLECRRIAGILERKAHSIREREYCEA
ncbi:MAG: hypothetical protein K2M82_02190 [Lachnospiraceae bacterium]|nr:hypothetical protein [Lachnospiraceae bacterium]